MTLYDKIWAVALRKIQTRMMSQREMEQKLMRDFPEDQGLVQKVIDEMKRVQLLNDRRFTEAYLQHLTQRAIGSLKIMVESRRKGLDPNLVEQILLDMGWSELESAKRALNEKERLLKNEADPRKRKQKLMRFLQSRGFADRVIFRGLRITE